MMSEFSREQQVAILLSAAVKAAGGTLSIPKAVFLAIEDHAILGMTKDAETGAVTLTLYEGELATRFRLQQGMPDAQA